jgi:hypothetical protein
LNYDEYIEVKKLAEETGISISQYCKDRIFPRANDFETIWREFLAKLKIFPSNVEFDVSTVMTMNSWSSLDKATKLSIARRFNKLVKNKEDYPSFADIQIVGRSSSNVTIYKK